MDNRGPVEMAVHYAMLMEDLEERQEVCALYALYDVAIKVRLLMVMFMK
jgi:hypothetical protein